jgi:pimeloyl-ACP methyl ester carboxylesterase
MRPSEAMTHSFSMQYAHLAGASLAYRRLGSGEDVVFIHGMAASHGFWHLNVLLPMTRRFRVTLYDQRGHGSSSLPPRGYTTAHLADDLLQLLDALQIPRAHLVGHSLGGAVALHLAAEHPDRVASLVIADTRVRALQPIQRPADWPLWGSVKARLAELGLELRDDVNDWGLHLFEQLASPRFAGAREKLAGTSLVIPFSRLAGGQRSAERWLELLNTTTARSDLVDVAGLTVDKLSQVACPVLAIYGERSTTLPSQVGLTEVVSDCRSVIVPGAGHFFPISCPDLFVREVCGFLHALDRAPTPAPAVIPVVETAAVSGLAGLDTVS